MLSLLLLSFVGLQFQLFHDVLEPPPLFGRQRDELQSETALPIPTGHGLSDAQGSIVPRHVDAELKRRPWLHLDEAKDTTSADGKVSEVPFSGHHIGGTEGTAELNGKTGMFPLFHERRLVDGALLALYIADRPQFRHCFCNSCAINGLDDVR